MKPLTSTQAKADSAWKHARGCKKAPRDCEQCQATIAWFRSQPLAELSRLLQEQPAPSMPPSLPLKSS